jgi:hypothetical protein
MHKLAILIVLAICPVFGESAEKMLSSCKVCASCVLALIMLRQLRLLLSLPRSGGQPVYQRWNHSLCASACRRSASEAKDKR